MLARLEFYGVIAGVFLILMGALGLYIRSNHNTINALNLKLEAATEQAAALKVSDDALRYEVAQIKIATDNANTDITLAQAMADRATRDIRAQPPITYKTNTKTLQGKVNNDTANTFKSFESFTDGK